MLVSIKGTSMVEILTSMCLIAVILIMLAQLQVFAYEKSHASYLFNLARLQMNNAGERLDVIRLAAESSSIMEIWKRQNVSLLPQGMVEIREQFPGYDISLYWGKSIGKCTNEINETCLTEKIQAG